MLLSVFPNSSQLSLQYSQDGISQALPFLVLLTVGTRIFDMLEICLTCLPWFVHETARI